MLCGVRQKLCQIFGHKVLVGPLECCACFFCSRFWPRFWPMPRGGHRGDCGHGRFPCAGVWPSRSPTGPPKPSHAKPSDAGQPRGRSSSHPLSPHLHPVSFLIGTAGSLSLFLSLSPFPSTYDQLRSLFCNENNAIFIFAFPLFVVLLDRLLALRPTCLWKALTSIEKHWKALKKH